MGIAALANKNDEKLENIYGWLFGKISDQDEQFMRQRLSRNLAGIASAASMLRPNEPPPMGFSSTEADVVIYCTLDRFQEGNPDATGARRLFDKSIGRFLKFAGAKVDCTRAFAITYSPSSDDEGLDRPDTMQICPWFLDYAIPKEFKQLNSMPSGKTGAMIKKLKLDQLTTKWPYTPIDLFSLFDKVLVHELSHTRSGGYSDDVGGSSGYGWKNCKKLSTSRNVNAYPDSNADSIALYASACALISKGGTVNEDGTFVESPGPAPGTGTRKRVLSIDPSDLKGRSIWQPHGEA